MWGTLAQLLLGAVGEGNATKLNAQQMAKLEELQALFRDEPLPDIKEIEAEQLGPSARGNVYSDPELEAAQMEALGQLGDISRDGGLTLADRNAMNEIESDLAAGERSRRASLGDEMARRGQLGSGAELQMALSGQSAAANRAAKFGADVAADAQARAIDAMLKRGDLAGKVRGQDFAESSYRAEGNDSRDVWNAGAREKAKYHNAGLAQQQFANRMARLAGQVPAGNNIASQLGANANSQRQFWGNAGAAVDSWLDDEEPKKK